MFTLEQLEFRSLATSVALTGGVLRIEGGEGYSTVEVDRLDAETLVVLADDETFYFSADEVRVILYASSEEGGDFFVDHTDERVIAVLRGSENVVVGADVVVDRAIDSIIEEAA